MNKHFEELKDLEIIGLIESHLSIDNTRAFKAIYARFYRMIERFILSNTGTAIQAEDVFQDSLIILFKKVKTKEFVLNASLGTYIYSVCKNLWLKELNKSSRLSKLTEEYDSIPIEQSTIDALLHNERVQMVATLLDQMGPDCKKILQLYYFEKLSMKQIKDKLGLSSEQIAKNKKSKCMKKLRTLVESKPALKEFFRY